MVIVARSSSYCSTYLLSLLLDLKLFGNGKAAKSPVGFICSFKLLKKPERSSACLGIVISGS